MSSDKSTPASGKPNGEAPATPQSPRSYAAVLRGDPEAPPTTAAAPSSVSSPSDKVLGKAQKILGATRMVKAPSEAMRMERDSAASQADSSVASSSSPAPLMSTISMALCAESTDLRAGWEAMKAKMAMEGQEVPPTTVPIPLRRREAAPSMPAAPQPEAQRSPSPAVTSPIRAPAPSSSALPSSLAAVSHTDLCAMAERVFIGTHRALYGVLAEEAPAASIAAASPIGPPAASSSPIPSPAAPSRRLPIQAPTYEVPAAYYADLEPLGWEVSASKSLSPKPVNSKPASPKPVSSEESIPFDNTDDLEQANSLENASGSIATPPQTPETSSQAAVRALHAEVNATENILEKGTRQYIDFEGTPEKPILDATEPSPSSGTFKDPSWFEKKTFRTPTPSKQAETPEETPKKRRLIESDDEFLSDDAGSDDEDISDDVEPANDAEEVSKPAPATPRSPAKRPRSPTPERPDVRPVLQAVRRNRRVRSAPGTTEAPLISVAQRQEMMRHKEHRCPDCDQECRYVNMDDVSETDEAMPPPSTPRSARGFTPEPIHGFEPMNDMDFEDAASDAGRSATPQSDVGRAASPIDFEMPPLEPFSPPVSPVRRSASRSISPMSGVSDVSLAMTSRPASPIRDLFCPRCHRDCNCPHVENPNPDFAPAPVRRRRGPRRVTIEEAWGRTANVDDIIGVDLPAPEPVLTEAMEVFDDGPLTANRQEKTIRRPTFQVVLFDNGVVVMRGTFDGVSLNSKLMAMAAKQPTVLFNDPDDRAVQIAAGRNHVVIRTRLGRLLTLGRGEEGQLGASERPQRYRQAAATVASLRRFIPGAAEVVFEDIKAFGNVTKAKAKNGPWYVCGQGFKGILTEVISRRRTL